MKHGLQWRRVQGRGHVAFGPDGVIWYQITSTGLGGWCLWAGEDEYYTGYGLRLGLRAAKMAAQDHYRRHIAPAVAAAFREAQRETADEAEETETCWICGEEVDQEGMMHCNKCSEKEEAEALVADQTAEALGGYPPNAKVFKKKKK